jgi:type IV pilus assembly protein PilF
MRNRDVARTSLDLSQQRLSEGNLNAAQDYARKALKADPELGRRLHHARRHRRRAGQRRGSRADYKRATELDPSGGTYNNYGAWLCANNPLGRVAGLVRPGAHRSFVHHARRRAGQRRALRARRRPGRSCQRDLHKAIELEPNNPVALDALARTAYKAGNYMEARAFSERRLAAHRHRRSATTCVTDRRQTRRQCRGGAIRSPPEGGIPGTSQGNARGSKSP